MNYSFENIISKVSSISSLDINSIVNNFELDIEELIKYYASEINNFLNDYFIKEMKDEYFKKK